MEAIRKLGNNAVICRDHSGRELIAIGSGIELPKCPYILDDLSKVDRMFYNIGAEYLSLFEDIDSKIFCISVDVIGLAVTIFSVPLKQSAVFTLVDHLDFALVRLKNGMVSITPIANESRDLYPVKVKIAKYTLNLLHKNLNIQLPGSEIYVIAMDTINSEETYTRNNQISLTAEFTQEIVKIIEGQMKVSIDTSSFNYSRSVSHMQYLSKRKSQYSEVSSTNKKLFEVLKKEYPDTFICVLLIKKMIFHKFNRGTEGEESLYLVLHANRSCFHEGIMNESA